MVIVTPLLVGTEGSRDVQSVGNYIAVTDPPAGNEAMYGKIMSLPDAVMESYYQFYGRAMQEVRSRISADPNEAKWSLPPDC